MFINYTVHILDLVTTVVAYLSSDSELFLRGKGGVPWVQIMENEFEYLADRGGHGGHLGEKLTNRHLKCSSDLKVISC